MSFAAAETRDICSGDGEGNCEALEVEPCVEEDAAISGSGGAEESAGERLRLAKEWGCQGSVGNAEIFPIQDILRKDG